MQTTQENAVAVSSLGAALPESGTPARSPYADYKIIRRNAPISSFHSRGANYI